MLPTNFSISYHYPPTIFVGPASGKTYTITDSGWVEIPADTTLEDLRNHWVDTSHSATNKVNIPKQMLIKEFEVLSSKGDSNYIVSVDNGKYSCTCIGYSFRRKCKHIEQIKQKLSV
jgi:hypothetical protein